MHCFTEDGKDLKRIADVLQDFRTGDQIIGFALKDARWGIELVINSHSTPMVPFQDLFKDRLGPAPIVQAGFSPGKRQHRLMDEITEESDIPLVADRIVMLLVQ